jgi:hypothetical protein
MGLGNPNLSLSLFAPGRPPPPAHKHNATRSAISIAMELDPGWFILVSESENSNIFECALFI